MQISLNSVGDKAVKKSRVPTQSLFACLNGHAEDVFVPNSVEGRTEGLSFKEALALARPETDRATKPDRINPASDALLVNLVDKMPADVMKLGFSAIGRWWKTGDATPEPLRPEVGSYQIGEEAPLVMESLVETLESVMEEFPDFQPHIGTEHVWSPQSRAGLGIGFAHRAGQALRGKRPFPVPIFGSKLVSALGLGATAMVMPTGKEDKLEAWLLKQPERSVEFHNLFREAYRLHEGDLYGTLLCAENVLSEGLYTEDRQDREVTRRLSYLRSDSAPAGDNFGAWYHLFGAALYSMVRPRWKADTILKIENMGSRILEGSDPQETHINDAGLELGRRLKRITDEGLGEPSHQVAYLNTSEFDWDRTDPKNWATRSISNQAPDQEPTREW